ncbi:MAG: hypothetical protein EOO94_02945 [Pedobacter sp.]|nr:MAG: hypothetical protein EOO94_02945 [Pedobacter sp.]
MGGVLDDSDEMPFEGDAPASSATTTYSNFATDSVHLNSGLISFEAAGATRQTMPQDFKISWENDVLVLTSPIAYSGIQPVNGGTAQVLIQGTQVIRLKK